MHIIYGFNSSSQKKYTEKFADNKFFIGHAVQKYHNLLIKGLKKNSAKVSCFSPLPINRNISKKLFICEKDETEDGVVYHYYKTVNLPLLRQITTFLCAFFCILCTKKESQTYIICDILNIANAFGMCFGGKLRKIPVCFIVTDLPQFESHGLTQKINEKLFGLGDSFILLTEAMNEIVNKKNKPYIVLEGHADVNDVPAENSGKEEYGTGIKTIIYAGSLKKRYGIEYLTKGFLKADIPNTVLKIFGEGDFREELSQLCKKHKNIIYMGLKPNSFVVEEEKKASLLVNPRPSHEEYTKYSFPSKNIEYMLSGTPCLFTGLSGMPKEYYDYIYLIEEENENGIETKLKEIFSLSPNERYDLGKAARNFVLEHKSNTVQAKKIINFLSK